MAHPDTERLYCLTRELRTQLGEWRRFAETVPPRKIGFWFRLIAARGIAAGFILCADDLERLLERCLPPKSLR